MIIRITIPLIASAIARPTAISDNAIGFEKKFRFESGGFLKQKYCKDFGALESEYGYALQKTSNPILCRNVRENELSFSAITTP